LAVTAALATAAPVRAASLPDFPGIDLIPAAEVLRSHTTTSATGDLLLVDAAGARIRLVTSIDDPAVANRGDGSFHPVAEEDARDALAGVAAPFLRPLQTSVYLLPYPRAGAIASSADSLAIYLAPGTDAGATRRAAARLLAHELGHAVAHRFLSAGDPWWGRYRELRGITDDARFHARAAHADRPAELFAEDFRVLFGGPAARGDGSVENGGLPSPETVAGLRELFLELPARLQPAAALLPAATLFPNPARAGTEVVLRLAADGPGSTPVAGRIEASLHDITGRRVAAWTAAPDANGQLRLRLPERAAAPAGACWIVLRSPDGAREALPLRLLP